MCICPHTEKVKKKKWLSATVILTHEPLSCRRVRPVWHPAIYVHGCQEGVQHYALLMDFLVSLQQSREMNCGDKNTCEKNLLYLNNSITEYLKCVTCLGQYIRPLTFHISAPVTRNPKHWSYNHQSVLRFDLVTTNVFNLEKRKEKISRTLKTRLFFFYFCVSILHTSPELAQFYDYLNLFWGVALKIQHSEGPRNAGKAFGRLGSYGGGRVNVLSLSAAVPSVAT